jgi:electron transport complex protein RnfE
MGIGFTSALFLMGSIREIIGNGTFFNIPIPVLQAGGWIEPTIILILPPGGFFVFGLLMAFANKLADKLVKKDTGVHDPLSEACAGAINEASACALCGACSIGTRFRSEQGFKDTTDAPDAPVKQ